MKDSISLYDLKLNDGRALTVGAPTLMEAISSAEEHYGGEMRVVSGKHMVSGLLTAGTRYAYFDLDGTLIAPLFQTKTNNGRINTVIGMNPEQWFEAFNKTGNLDFSRCRIVNPILDYAWELQTQGWKTYILTCVCSEGERKAKSDWFTGNSGVRKVFSNIHFVGSDPEEKIKFMEATIEDFDLPNRNVILVDDTMLFTISAAARGYRALHTSHVLTRHDTPDYSMFY